jgi:hypothetical protein
LKLSPLSFVLAFWDTGIDREKAAKVHGCPLMAFESILLTAEMHRRLASVLLDRTISGSGGGDRRAAAKAGATILE